MSTIVNFKMLILLAAILSILTAAYVAAQKPAIRTATPQEKKAQTQAMTGWGDTFTHAK